MNAACQKFDPEEYERTFTSLMERESAGTVSNPAGLGTVFDLAKRGGWKPTHGTAAQTEAGTASNDEGGALGDIRAGRLFAKAKRGKLLYATTSAHWSEWTGSVWNACKKGEEVRAAKEVADKIHAKAGELFRADADRYRKTMHWAGELQKRPRLEAMIELAKSEDGMTVGHPAEFDADPFLLCVKNGVVNLKTGALLASDPAMLQTRQCNAEYHQDAECPRWLKFLEDVFEGDAETVRFIQRGLGYTLTGVTNEEAVFICFGSGANGKSVFNNVVSSIFGTYGDAVSSAVLVMKRPGDSSPTPELAETCGLRLASLNETQNGDRLNARQAKVFGGNESVRARKLYGAPFTFRPTAKIWMRTNYLPVVTETDDGTWRRLHPIHFRRQFAENERDPWLESKLLEERDGILRWMVEGCLEWLRLRSLKPSPTVLRESANYRIESDVLAQCLAETTIPNPGGRVLQAKLYEAMRKWYEGMGLSVGAAPSVTRSLKQRGIQSVPSNGKRFYVGLALLEGG